MLKKSQHYLSGPTLVPSTGGAGKLDRLAPSGLPPSAATGELTWRQFCVRNESYPVCVFKYLLELRALQVLISTASKFSRRIDWFKSRGYCM